MYTKLIQAAAFTFVLHLLMGLSNPKSSQIPLAIEQNSSFEQATFQLLPSPVAE